jgi:hypothetical protein
MDEQGKSLTSDEASQLYSQLQTSHVLSIQNNSFDYAVNIVSIKMMVKWWIQIPGTVWKVPHLL